jgi:hypothetical protein
MGFPAGLGPGSGWPDYRDAAGSSDYSVLYPPLTLMVCPWMKEAASEQT